MTGPSGGQTQVVTLNRAHETLVTLEERLVEVLAEFSSSIGKLDEGVEVPTNAPIPQPSGSGMIADLYKQVIRIQHQADDLGALANKLSALI